MTRLSRRRFLQAAGTALAAVSAPAWLRSGRALARGSITDADRILEAALSTGGNYADLFIETRGLIRIAIANSEVTAMDYGVVQGGGVHTVLGGKTGYAFAESLDAEPLIAAARTAASIAAGSAAIQPAPVHELSFARYVSFEQPIGQASVSQRVAILERVDRAARAVSPAISQVTLDYADENQQFTIANSDGVYAEDELPLIYLRVTVTAERNGVQSEGGYRLSARRGMELLNGDAPEQAGRAAAEQAVRMLDAVPAPAGEMPVVIAAGGGVVFHEAVGHGLEADAVLHQASVFAERLGEKVSSELVTMFDDGTVPNARGSFNIDDEGMPAERTLLIERGRLLGFMHDRRTASLMKVAPTGNGRRQSYRFPAIPRMTNTYVERGSDSAEEVIRATPRGIYAVDFGGGQVDTGSGQFTFGLREAYLIENGKVTAPIRGANLVGSGPDVLQKIDRVAGDFGSWPGTCGKGDQSAPVTSGCPTLRISSITVGGTA